MINFDFYKNIEQKTKNELNMTVDKQKNIDLLEKQRAFEEGVATLQDLIAPAAIQITPYYLQVGDYFSRTIFIYTYPRYLNSDWFSPVINLDVLFDAGMFIYPLISEQVMKKLTRRTAQIQSTITDLEEKGQVRNPMLETAYRDVEDLRDKLQQGTERLFKFGLYVTLYATNLKKLNDVTKKVESLLSANLIYGKQAVFQTEQGFNSTLPLANDELHIVNNMNTSALATSFPFVSAELTFNNGVLYGINRHNNSLILFDRFSLENANTVVLGKSGGGKSYTIKLEVLRSLMLDTDVIIVDPENEYQFLTDAVGGNFIKLSLNSDTRINPFDLPKPLKDENPDDVLRSAVINLKGLLRLILGPQNPQKDALLDQSLIETYRLKGITESTDWQGREMPIMSDFVSVLNNMQGAEDLAVALKKYTEGTFAGIFNQTTNVSLDSQLVVFSIRDIEDELRPTAMYVVLNHLWNMVRSQLKKRILIVDEAWWMMQNADSARFLYSMAKRARKYYLGLTTISQDVQDFLTNTMGQAIVTNSSLQLLLKQSPASIDLIKRTFNLTEEEKYLLLESNVGEGIFFAGHKHAAIRVVASYSEDQMITSDPRQLLEIERAKEEFAEAIGDSVARDQ